MMKFEVGDRVNLRVGKDYGSEQFPAGTAGDVEKVYPFSESYLVALQGAKASHRIMEDDLEGANYEIRRRRRSHAKRR